MTEAITIVETLAIKLENGLTILAQQFGVGADHFYPIIVEQQVVSGWLWVGISIPLLIIATFFIIVSFQQVKEGKDIFSSVTAGLIFYLVAGTTIAVNIGSIINPEYYALHEVMNMLQNLK